MTDGTKALVLLLILPFTMAWFGFVVSIMWGWFVAPITGWPDLTLPAAIGIVLVADLFSRSDSCDESTAERVFYGFLKSLMLLGIGWLVHGLI
jgi:hypothetical protein